MKISEYALVGKGLEKPKTTVADIKAFPRSESMKLYPRCIERTGIVAKESEILVGITEEGDKAVVVATGQEKVFYTAITLLLVCDMKNPDHYAGATVGADGLVTKTAVVNAETRERRMVLIDQLVDGFGIEKSPFDKFRVTEVNGKSVTTLDESGKPIVAETMLERNNFACDVMLDADLKPVMLLLPDKKGNFTVPAFPLVLVEQTPLPQDRILGHGKEKPAA